MIDHAAGARGGFEQVGLTRQERRNLQDVGDLGDRRGVRGLVDVGQDGDAGSLADARRASASPSSSPGPRNERPEVRFALSYEALKT